MRDGLLSLVGFWEDGFLPAGQGGRQAGACPQWGLLGSPRWGAGGKAESWGCS